MRGVGGRRWMLVAYAVLSAAAIMAAFWQLSAALDHKLMDEQMRFLRKHVPRPAANDVVLVGLDEAFLGSVREPVALLHPHLAKFLAAMVLARPTVVGLDIVLPQRSYRFLAPADAPETNYDLLLVRAFHQAKQSFPVVVAKTWDVASGAFRGILVDYVAAARRAGPAVADGDPRASVLVCPDEDGVVRRYPGAQCQPDGSNWVFSAKIAAYAGNAQTWSGAIDYTIGSPMRYVALGDLLHWLDAGDEARLAAAFRGRIVLLGPMLAFEDRHVVPVELAAWEPGNTHVPGVLIHAQALRSIMGTGLLQPMHRALEPLLAALFTLLWFVRRPWLGAAAYALAAALLAFASTRLLLHGAILPIVTPLAAGLAALALRFALEALHSAREKNFLKSSFSGYVSPQVLREILSGRLQPGQKAGRTRACILFADIRGFTRRSESLAPERLVAMLNRYFAVMSEVIHKHGGTVDKFIGDGLMAIFGAPQGLERPEQNALEAAQEMVERLAQVNRELSAQGEEPLRIGIGLHSGEVVVGHIGSQERHEYTAIGDVVNVASRLEGMSADAGHVIICSRAVAAALGYPQVLASLGERPVEGGSPQFVYGWNPAVLAAA